MDNDYIKKIVYPLGADVCGFANIGRFDNAPKGFHPLDVYAETKSIIVFGSNFHQVYFKQTLMYLTHFLKIILLNC